MRDSPAQGVRAQGAEEGARVGRLPRAGGEEGISARGRLTGCRSPSEGRRVWREVCTGRQSSVGSWRPSGVRVCLCGRVAQHSILDPKQGEDGTVGLSEPGWGAEDFHVGGLGAGHWNTGSVRRASTWERRWMVAVICRENDCISK